MTIRLYDIPKSFDFLEHVRSEIIFSDDTKIRLDAAEHVFKLVSDENGHYPTDDDIYVVSQPFYPKANKVWRIFEAYFTLPENTSIQYRLHDGTNHLWWNGASWVVAGAGDWNTEGEISSNIPDFPLGTLRLVFNLKSVDGIATPEMREARVGYSAQLVFADDWLYRTLIPAIKAGVNPIARWPIKLDADASSVDLNDYTLENPFVITDMDSAYDHTADSEHHVDILDSYNPTTKIVTLTTTVPAGNVLWLLFVYQPHVTVQNSVDYQELQVPAIVLENLRLEEIISGMWNGIANKDAGVAYHYPPPIQNTLLGDILFLAPGNYDEVSMPESARGWAEENQAIRVNGTDDLADLVIEEAYSQEPFANLTDLRQARLSFQLRNLYAWLRPALTAYPISKFRFTGDINMDVPS
jgi:hypothetical protein